MLMRTWWAFRVAMNPGWAPWSVLKISGRPKRASASCRASTQKSAVSVLESFQERTLRVNQSMTATKYTKPRAIGM